MRADSAEKKVKYNYILLLPSAAGIPWLQIPLIINNAHFRTANRYILHTTSK